MAAFVLVHGTGHGGCCWQKVVPILRAPPGLKSMRRNRVWPLRKQGESSGLGRAGDSDGSRCDADRAGHSGQAAFRIRGDGPVVYGSGSTVHRRFQQWRESSAFDEMVALLLQWYDEQQGIGWRWQSGGTKLLPAPLGGDKTGPNPTDLGKLGTKRHLLVDGKGVPLALYLSAAHRHDVKGLPPLLNRGWLTDRQPPDETGVQHICLDKAYDDQETETFLEERGCIHHIKQRGEPDEPGFGEPVYPPRRWKVERTISWMNDMRKLRIRWEKKAANYRALWLIAFSLVIFRRTVLG